MHCPSCGTWYADSQLFCVTCGDILSHDDSPAKIGHYRLIAPIGQGGVGMVFHAFDEILERDVALKVLHQHIIEERKQLKRFQREARMHGQLNHPNIIRLLDSQDYLDSLALIMELAVGCSLQEYMRFRGALETGEIVTIADAVLAALQAAHDRQVTHRDMKLSNIFLCDDGAIKLMDFGLAKRGDNPEEDITDSGVTIGSYYYMAPEQVLGRKLDGRTDLYAFGIILYRLATGKLPFTASGGAEFEIMEKQVRQQPQPPEQVNPEMPPELARLIMQMLAKEPEQRPDSCQAVRQMLAAIAPQKPLSMVNQVTKETIGSFSELHTYRSEQKKHAAKRSNASERSVSGRIDEIPPYTMIWAFRNSPVALETPPLDLRSPPAIESGKLRQLQQAIKQIPPLPDSWYRIQDIIHSAHTTPSDLAGEVAQDALLTEQLLELCNSAAYAAAGSKPVTDIAMALTRLGMDTAHDVILQMLVPDFGSGSNSNTQVRAIWYHGRAISLISRALAGYSHLLDNHSASLFGMLHDIGKLVIVHCEKQQKLDRLRKAIDSGTPALKAEWDVLGYTHIDAGMMLALHWRLPRSIHHFIYYHHHPAWYRADAWPTDLQAVIMLIHTAHLIVEMIDEESDKQPLIWSNKRRPHIPETESFLYRPLQLPLTSTEVYGQLEQELNRLKISFPLLFPDAA